MLVKNSTESRLLIRDFLKAGIIYSALGLFQFGSGRLFGTDPFPVIRYAGDSIVLQDMVGLGGQGRITSICGEPRTFSAFLTIWLVFSVACGLLAGFRSWQAKALCALFLVTNILTGSRSGLAELALILGSLLVLCFVQRSSAFIRRTAEILMLVSLGLLMVALVEGLVIRGRTGIGQDSMNDQVEIGNLSVPIEFQDKQAFLLFIEKPLNVMAGSGAGLWQYQTDPYSSDGFRRYFFDQGVSALDSMRQNITTLSLVADFGLVGLWLAFRFYGFCLRLAERRGSRRAAREFKPALSVLLVALMIDATTDTYCNVMVFLVFTLWIQLGVEERVSAMRVGYRLNEVTIAGGPVVAHSRLDR
jgi:hypothetical protein